MMYRASGPSGAFGCGLGLLFLGLFLLTPVGLFLIKGVAWALVGVGAVLAALSLWAWLRTRRF